MPTQESAATPLAVTKPPPDPFERHYLDLHAVSAGKWVEIHGDEFLVAKLGTEDSARVRSDLLAEIGLPASADVPPDRVEWFMGELLARHVIRDARFANGATFSAAAVKRIASDPTLEALRGRIIAEAQGDYRACVVRKAAILGN
jgi:hypothetical protein